jgi:SAM-dependent methyltransferase
VTIQGAQAAEIWRDDDFARSWAAGDSIHDLLNFPRRMAAAIVAEDLPAPATIVDIGAGPGAVLAVFLERFPGAKGVWSDVSMSMLDMAKERLAPFGDRVEYVLADMTALEGTGLPDQADVITTSRAAHHFDKAGLAAFYAAAARRLKPGGWLVNLDHVGPASQAGPPGVAGFDEVWDQRLRSARKAFGVASNGPKHHHNYPLTSVQDHLDAFGAAGITDVEVTWRAFITCLFTGRKAG